MVVLYMTLFLIISVATFLQFFSNKVATFWFLIFGIVLTLLSMFRFGSGTDYFGYMMDYNLSPNTILESIQNQSHMDIGYRVLVGLFKSFDVNFTIFIMVISFVIMFIYLKVIKENSKFNLLSLLIFYAAYYSIYVNSALRQGIAMAIFFIAFYRYFQNGKTIKYLIMIALASLFHSSALIMVVMPIIKYTYKRMFSNKILNIILLLSSVFLCLSKLGNLVVPLGRVFGMVNSYVITSFNPMAIALRIVSVIFIYILYKSNEKGNISEFDKLQIYTYFLGSVLFISVANLEILSRILEYFTIIEVILIPNLIKGIRFRTTKIASFAFIIMLIGMLFIKDISSFIDQGNYYVTSITDYKYVTIFNKEDIYKYRIVTVHDDSY